MHSPHNTDDEIKIQLREAEQMIMEHDSSKEQRKKKRKPDGGEKEEVEHMISSYS